MDNESKRKIADLGGFHIVLSACLECEDDQPLPDSFLTAFKRKKADGTLPTTSTKLPPRIQALWKQEALIARQITEVFEEISGHERTLLNGRFGLIRGSKTQLISELLANFTDNPVNQQDLTLGPNWYLHFPLPTK